MTGRERERDRERESAKMERRCSSNELHNLIEAIKSSEVSFLWTLSDDNFQFDLTLKSFKILQVVENRVEMLTQLRDLDLSENSDLNYLIQCLTVSFPSLLKFMCQFCDDLVFVTLTRNLDVLGGFYLFGCITVYVEQNYFTRSREICGFRSVWLSVTVSPTWSEGMAVSFLRFLRCHCVCTIVS